MFRQLSRHKKKVFGLLGGGGLAASYYYYTNNTTTNSLPPLNSSLQPNTSLVCELIEKETVSDDTCRFRFALPTPNHLLGLHSPTSDKIASSHIVAHDDAMIARAYTPISMFYTKGYFDLLIKRYDGGEFSTQFHDKMKLGSTMQFRGPVMTLPNLPSNKYKTVLMICGGTGITPMYQIIRNILFIKKNEKLKLVLLYANRSDILLKQELDLLQTKYPNRIQIQYVLEEKKGKNNSSNNILFGKRIDLALLRKFIPTDTDSSTAILVCGPNGMLSSLCGNYRSNSRNRQPQLGGLLHTAVADIDSNNNQDVFMLSDVGVVQFKS